MLGRTLGIDLRFGLQLKELELQADMEHNHNDWLINFLVETAKGEYNPFDSKDKIKIVTLDDQEEAE